ncbi:MAG: hypothetical protein CO095_11630 [Armatimonadetes bacterium CG_4_9_14_3_um_filter_58_7]|nr:MAG: hypothetical protein CO095_11630 [Armatimonadetes bacterium CG_4_9_14_3_um_filter_58_7]
MPLATAEEVYETVIAPLSMKEQIRLVERIAHQLAGQSRESVSPSGYDWMSVRAIAPNLLSGEDAQQWVSQSRLGADDSRKGTVEGGRF